MQIQVFTNYGGKNTQERRIAPGLYDAGDERLFGLAQYLVTHGFARVVETIGSTVETPPVAVYAPVEGSPDDTWMNIQDSGKKEVEQVDKSPGLNAMTKAQLIEFAALHEMDIDTNASKTSILEAVKAQWENTY